MEYLPLILFKSENEFSSVWNCLSVGMPQDKEDRLEDLSRVLPFIILYNSLHCFTAFGGRAFIFPISNTLEQRAQPSFSDSLIFPLP